MKSSNKYYKDLNILRIIACIGVLLYHFNILKGGFFAVSTFFVLSGYLTCKSATNEGNFSLKKYYINKIKKLYIPLLIVVFLTISIISLTEHALWLNIKPETTSVLLGYNNYYQIKMNLDYFTPSINSPFTHLWFIGVLIEFDLIFPFLYILLKKIEKKTKKIIPVIITSLLTLASILYFMITYQKGNMTVTYYDTISRIFPLFMGVTLSLIHTYYKPLIKETSKYNKIKYLIYTLILILYFILIDETSKYFHLHMIIVSLISCRLIEYSITNKENIKTKKDKIIEYFSKITYPIYLISCPLIYILNDIHINNILKIVIILTLTLILSSIIYFITTKTEKHKILKIIIITITLTFTLHGLYEFITSKDCTKEMKELEKQLEENEKLAKEKQKEYEKLLKENEEELKKLINTIETNGEVLKSKIKEIPITGIGDFVMLGAVNNLYKHFTNGYFDAKVSRTAWAVNGILDTLESKNMIGEIVIINLGANGDTPEYVKESILEKLKNKKVFWINVTNDDSVKINDDLDNLAKKHKNLYIIDWETISKNHPEYFYKDGIHLTETGKEAYINAINDAIYNVYLNENLEKKNEIINKYEEENKNKITFYGNNILLNAFNYIEKDFKDAKFVIKDFNYKTLKKELEKEIKNDDLTNKIVIIFDETTNLSTKEYESILEMTKDKKIFIVATNKKTYNNLKKIKKENLTIINLYEELKENEKYLMIDKKHLTEEGNKKLNEIIKNTLKD